jgi:hypothetical protein
VPGLAALAVGRAACSGRRTDAFSRGGPAAGGGDGEAPVRAGGRATTPPSDAPTIVMVPQAEPEIALAAGRSAASTTFGQGGRGGRV